MLLTLNMHFPLWPQRFSVGGFEKVEQLNIRRRYYLSLKQQLAMAELEVIKHAKKGYHTLKDPNKNWMEKLKEIAVEIFIIVFAISLTLYLEHLVEKHHERQIAREFLTGLKEDLHSDLNELTSDSATYARVQRGFSYFTNAGVTGVMATDSIQKYYWTLRNTTLLLPNNSRFEGLKSSGNLDVIENKEVLNGILELYQEKIPNLMMVTNNFNAIKQNRLMPYLDENLVMANGSVNLDALLKRPILQNYLRYGANITEILASYHQVLAQCRFILRKIEKDER